MYQLEEGEGHNSTVWNRSLYNFAQRIFLDDQITGTVQMATVSAQKAALRQYHLNLTSLGMNIVRTGKPQVFSLNGRVITSIRTDKAVSRTFGRNR
jgi:hypothetical protein